jgi:hypothetical protein
VITDLSFGEEFGFLAKDEDVYEYCAAVKQMMPVMDAVTLFPRLVRFFQTKLQKSSLYLPNTMLQDLAK